MLKKVLLTIFCVLSPTIGFAVLFKSLDIFQVFSYFSDGHIWKGIGTLISMILVLLPMWYVWKGTKLIPFITIFPIRVLLITAVLLCAPIGSLLEGMGEHFKDDAMIASGHTIMTIGVGSIIFLALWGIWVKS